MEDVQRWLDDGALNTENFFVDEDARVVDGASSVSVGGIFTFRVAHAAPHSCAVINAGASAALGRFGTKVQGPFASVAAALGAATAAYLEISDALDEEACADDDDDEDDAYGEAGEYGGGEVDDLVDAAQEERRRKQREMDARYDEVRASYDVGRLSKSTVERILSDYQNVLKTTKEGWDATPDGRHLDRWNITVFGFDKGSQLEKDMAKVKARTGDGNIQMVMTFPTDYPFRPPFIRVVRPRFQFRTGHVTIGGSICTKFLTDEGWQPVFDIESTIVSIRAQMLSPDAKGAIDHGNTSDYTEAEAREAFQRVADHHRRVGW